jgi:phage regulator Rha-like protein
MFQLTDGENGALRSQFATSKKTRGGRRYTPHAFTEHGAIMAATVLNSKRAVQMSVFVVRAFVRLREMLATNRRLAGKIAELENRLDTHDSAIQDLIEAIKELMTPKERPRRRIGFQLPPAKANG